MFVTSTICIGIENKYDFILYIIFQKYNLISIYIHVSLTYQKLLKTLNAQIINLSKMCKIQVRFIIAIECK